MNNQEYWRKRSEEIAKMQFDKSDEYAAKLRKEYEKAISSIQRDLEVFYERYAENNEISMAEARKLLNSRELNEFRLTVEEFIEKAKNNADGRWTKELNNIYFKTRISRLEALLTQIRQQAEMIAGKTHKSTTAILQDIYMDTYYRTLFEIQKGTGIGVSFAKVDDKALSKVMQTRWIGENYSERIWGNRDKLVYELQTKLSQSFIRGDSIDRTAKAMADRMNVSYSNAARIVNTESSFIAHQATADSYEASGIIKQYEYLATLDNRTSEICRSMDGKVFNLSDKQVGINWPPLHPNCRSTTVPYFGDEEDIGERIARDASGKTYYVPGNMTYERWYDKYVTK
jgi:SPP1 gp7 family putative phage head morphogenesis protein